MSPHKGDVTHNIPPVTMPRWCMEARVAIGEVEQLPWRRQCSFPILEQRKTILK